MENLVQILIVFIALTVSCLRQVKVGHVGVMYTLGKLTAIKNTGWRFVIPIFQSLQNVKKGSQEHQILMQLIQTKSTSAGGKY